MYTHLKPLCLFVLVGCAPEAIESSMSEAEEIALDASMRSLDPVREDLPIEDESLELLARDFVDASRPDLGCEIQGVMSGVWYEPNIFEGSWFQLGTGELGGTLRGTYGDGGFEGVADGTDVGAEVAGEYQDGNFVGTWETPTGGGDLGGHYERRNELGGYYFGLW